MGSLSIIHPHSPIQITKTKIKKIKIPCLNQVSFKKTSDSCFDYFITIWKSFFSLFCCKKFSLPCCHLHSLLCLFAFLLLISFPRVSLVSLWAASSLGFITSVEDPPAVEAQQDWPSSVSVTPLLCMFEQNQVNFNTYKVTGVQVSDKSSDVKSLRQTCIDVFTTSGKSDIHSFRLLLHCGVFCSSSQMNECGFIRTVGAEKKKNIGRWGALACGNDTPHADHRRLVCVCVRISMSMCRPSITVTGGCVFT